MIARSVFLLLALTFVAFARSNSQGAIRSASLDQVESALASLDKRIAEERGALKVLIPRATHVTDLYELWRDYPHGFLDTEIDSMARTQGDLLSKDNKLFGAGYDEEKAQALTTQGSQQMEALISEVNLWISRRNELTSANAGNAEAVADNANEMFQPVETSMPSIEARRENVRKGRVPLTRTELDRFLSGRPLSSMASTSEKNAWLMTEVMLGLKPERDMPEEYGGLPKGNSRRAIAARRQWERNQAYKRAVAAGPAAAQQFLQNEKTQQSLQNVEFQQMQLKQQLDQLEWQQQIQRFHGW
jgi:hypothetical protein